MTRRTTALAAICLVAAIIIVDSLATPPNPFAAPSALALGSGLPPSGGFCAALPE